MIVKLKYSVGDEVWIMLGNRPQRVKIHSIVISCYKSGTYYSYKCELPNGKIYSKNSYQVFKTKKELIEITGEANEVSNGFSKTIKEYVELMRKFDKLPWWSKMFFKFGI